MARITYPNAGTPVAVYWEDIYEDVVGNPDAAVTAERVSIGYYLGRKRKGKRWYIITSTTRESWTAGSGTEDQSGWCAYPVGAVVKLIPLKEVSAE